MTSCSSPRTNGHLFFLMPVTASVLSTVFLLAAPSRAQNNSSTTGSGARTLTVGINGPSKYSIRVPKNYRVKPDGNGNITVRALLTMTLTRLPSDYKRADEAAKNTVSGSALGSYFIGDNANEYRDKLGEYHSTNPTNPTNPANPANPANPPQPFTGIEEAVKTPPYRETDDQKTRIKSVDDNLVGYVSQRLSALRIQADVNIKEQTIGDPEALWIAADVRATTLDTRLELLRGTNTINPVEYTSGLPKSLKVLHSLDDITSDKAKSDTVTAENLKDVLQKYGQWDFVQIPATVNGVTVNFVEARVTWAVEVTFDPASDVKLPIVETRISNAAASGQPSTATATESNNAASVFGGLGVSPAVAAAVPTGSPRAGIDYIAGVSIQNNGPQSVIGVNLFPATADGTPSFSIRFGRIFGKRESTLNLSGLGLVVGKAQGSDNGYVFAPSFRLNRHSNIFIGGSFRSANGSLRAAPAIGASLNILDALQPRENNNSSSSDVVVESKESTPLSVARVKEKEAVLIISDDVPRPYTARSGPNKEQIKSFGIPRLIDVETPYKLAYISAGNVVGLETFTVTRVIAANAPGQKIALVDGGFTAVAGQIYFVTPAKEK